MSEQQFSVELMNPADVILDDNVRTQAKPSAELVESIRTQGVLAPVIAHRDMLGQVMVTDGQLRVLAAREVLCEKIPVLVGPPPGSAENRIMEQLALNEAREQMRASDVAAAVEQLSLFGVEASTIARRIGRKREDVENLQKFAKAKKVKGVADSAPVMDTVQMAKLAELSGNPFCTDAFLEKVEKDLADGVVPNAVLRTLESSVSEESLIQPVEAKLREEGHSTIRFSEAGSESAALKNLTEADGSAIDSKAHAEACPGHVMLIQASYEGMNRVFKGVPACVNFRSHGHKLRWEAVSPSSLDEVQRAQWEREQKEKAEKEERRAAFKYEWKQCEDHREEFVKGLLCKQPAGFLETVLWRAMPNAGGAWDLANPKELLSAAGLLPVEVSAKTWASTHIKNVKMALYAGALQAVLEDLTFVPTKHTAAYVRETLRFMVGCGYEPLPVEEQFIESFDNAHEELFL